MRDETHPGQNAATPIHGQGRSRNILEMNSVAIAAISAGSSMYIIVKGTAGRNATAAGWVRKRCPGQILAGNCAETPRTGVAAIRVGCYSHSRQVRSLLVAVRGWWTLSEDGWVVGDDGQGPGCRRGCSCKLRLSLLADFREITTNFGSRVLPDAKSADSSTTRSALRHAGNFASP